MKMSVYVLAGCATLAGCASLVERPYHCVSVQNSAELKSGRKPSVLIEEFRYGDQRFSEMQNFKAVGGLTRCDSEKIPESAYIRYVFEGKEIEKHLELSSLSLIELENKTLEFEIKGDSVEVWKITPISRAAPIKELIVKK